jgi:hypothetical protein
MKRLPDDALVVRGGKNLASSFEKGTKVSIDENGKLRNVSVNSLGGLTLEELVAPDPTTGYPGIPHKQVGVTTAGTIRAAGGEVVSSPTRTNSKHATLSGLTPEEASRLFQPTQKNPNR